MPYFAFWAPQGLAPPYAPSLISHYKSFAYAKHLLCCYSPSNFFILFCSFLKPWLRSHLLQKHLLATLPSYHLCIPSVQWLSSLAACWNHRGALENTNACPTPPRHSDLICLGARLGTGTFKFSCAAKFPNHLLKSFGLIALHRESWLGGDLKTRFLGCTSGGSDI